MDDDELNYENEFDQNSFYNSPEESQYILNDLDKKIMELFPGEAVNKKLTKTGILTSRALPAFVSDLLIGKFSHEGTLDTIALQKFLDTYLPDKSRAEEIKFNIKNDNVRVKLLADFRVTPDIQSGDDYLEIPILDIVGKEGTIDPLLIKKSPELLNGGMWGVGELLYSQPEPKKKDGKIVLKEFTPFRP